MIRKLRQYNFKNFFGDCFGGLIAALIALPYGLAMATLMGLPPVLGLFTSLLTAPITAFLGRNPVLIGGCSTVTVPFLAIAVKQQGIGGAAKVTLVAAVFMMAFSVLRLGRYISKVPPTVVSGFSCGIGAMMVISQLKTIFGLNIPVTGATAIIIQLTEVLAHITELRWSPLIYGAAVILAAFGVAKLAPKAPAPLLGVIFAVGVGYLFGLHEKEVGTLPLELPPFAGFTWSAADVYQVLPSGLALAFVASINLLITSRVVEHFRGRHRPMKPADADAELGAYGIANVCAGIFGAPMSVGIPARSLANVRCGGVSRLSNLMHGVFLFACLSLGAGFVSHIPIPALAGVTAYVGILLLEWGTWRRLPKMRPVDAAAFLSTALSTLLLNAVAAVVIGCSMYGLQWLYERYRPAHAAPQLSPAKAND
ncbi:MAG: SulP family inorganic anion transporter [Bryobacteraceae bacterium]|nr:SulP family inorganic anion transporter [Bryobacteraceae bacterium]